MTIDREMFDEWLANPITEYVLARMAEIAEQNKQLWIAKSWDAGECDPATLTVLKATATAAADLSKIEWSDISDDERERHLSN